MNWIKLGFLMTVLTIGSCKNVKYGLSGINIPPEVKTVSIQLFENNAPLVNPLLAQVLTEKLKDKFLRQTGLKLVTENGDWQFKGNITNYAVEAVNRQTIEGGTRNKLTINVRVNFVNTVSSKDNFDKDFTRFEDFDAGRNFSDVEANLVDVITSTLVTDIFNETALQW